MHLQLFYCSLQAKSSRHLDSMSESTFLCWTVTLPREGGGNKLVLARQPSSCKNQLILPQIFNVFIKPIRGSASQVQWNAAIEATEGISYLVDSENIRSLVEMNALKRVVQMAAMAGIKESARLLVRFGVHDKVAKCIMRLECESPPPMEQT